MSNSITSSIVLGADMEQGIAGKLDGNGELVPVAANTDSVFGVTINGGKQGQRIGVVRSGEARMQVDDASLSDGDLTSIDSSGRAVADSGGGETVIGEALQDGLAKPAGEEAARVRVNLFVDKS
jgi:hypothetical protein